VSVESGEKNMTLRNLVKVAKAVFTWAICGAVLGLFSGMILGGIVWYDSNLGPLAGFIYGAPAGTVLGAGYGLVSSVRRARKHSI
jgi:ABC-type multidrug transport system permease subunit